MSRAECAGASRRWFHHGGTHKRGNQVCTETRPGCSLVENVRFDFFLIVNVRVDKEREGGRERTRRNGESKSALSVHSHPFDHSSSISDLDLECNSRQEVRGTGLNGRRGRRTKCRELKLKALERRNKKRLGIRDEKRRDKREKVNKEN